MKRQINVMITLCTMLVVLLSGCSIEQTNTSKLKDIDFTVVEENEIPDDLITLIDDKKEDNFKLTFITEQYLYIVVGYGRQLTNGYSISVEDLYLTKNAVCIKTSLIGPAKDDDVSDVNSYPFVVVKIESIDKNVVFE